MCSAKRIPATIRLFIILSLHLKTRWNYSGDPALPIQQFIKSLKIDPAPAQGHLDRALGTSVLHAVGIKAGKHLPTAFVQVSMEVEP